MAPDINCTSANEVLFSLAYLFVSMIMQKLHYWFGGKLARGPRKKPLDFDGNRDNVTFRLQLWLDSRLTPLVLRTGRYAFI